MMRFNRGTYSIYENQYSLRIRIDFESRKIAEEMVSWLYDNIPDWEEKDTHKDYIKRCLFPSANGSDMFSVPFYINFHNQADYIHFKLAWG